MDAAHQELNDFRELILWLHDKHQSYFDNLSEPEHSFVYTKLIQTFSPTNERLLESNLPKGERLKFNSLELGWFLYLSPDPCPRNAKRQIFIPFISLVCNFESTSPEVRVYVALAQKLRAKDEIRILGLRFEAPEGDGDGLHDFYHSQLVHNLRASGRSIPLNHSDLELDWIPDSQPSIPIDASCSVTLLLSALTSLYGIRYLDTLLTEGAVPERYLAKIQSWNALPRYWAAENSKGERHFFKTTSVFDESKRAIIRSKVKDNSAKIARVTGDEYRAALVEGRAQKI